MLQWRSGGGHNEDTSFAATHRGLMWMKIFILESKFLHFYSISNLSHMK